MVCRKPFIRGSVAFGCGQCIPCRISRRRVWTHRILLECFSHPASSFVTLTYDEGRLPEGASLRKKDTQDWLKRLRYELSERKLRYFCVGEYGEMTQRPHYHLALYGVAPVESELVRQTWGMGHVYLGELTPESAQYVAGYCVKKWTNKRDPFVVEKLRGREPEFATMSRRPGIGGDSLDPIVDMLSSEQGFYFIEDNEDVPSVLRHGSKMLPLGRYLRSKIKEKYGFKEEVSQRKWSEYQAEMRELFTKALEAPENKKKGVKEILWQMNESKVLTIEKRSEIYRKKEVL